VPERNDIREFQAGGVHVDDQTTTGGRLMIGISALAHDGFVLRPHQVGTVLHVEFSGCADNDAQALLPGYFKLMHAEVERSGMTEVVVDIHGLYFINSSCLKAIVTWIDLLNAMASDRRYRIRFLKDPRLRWQTRSFDALHRMCMANVSVEDWSGGTT
jgi:hypothetical protein